MSSSHISVPSFKSSLRVSVSSLFRSRERSRDKIQQLQKRLEDQEKHRQRVVNEKRELEERFERQHRELQKSQQEIARLSAAPVLLRDPNLYRHGFGPRMIAMSCNLAKVVGFRAAEAVLKIVRTWLGTDFKIPSWTSIRTWLCRSGVAALTEACERHGDWILKIDHSVQLGETNVLVVLGIRQSELPEGRALRHEDLKTLAVVPGVSRSKESVTAALKDLTDQIGLPVCVVADGASELYEGVKALKNNGQSVLFLDDIKHKAANILKKTLGKQERFLKFQSHIGVTTARIQQTELVHFLPPKKRAKCRFMNLPPLLNWGQMALYHLQNPSAPGNAGLADDRLQDKLGWLLEHEDDLKSWQVCQGIVSATLAFTNVRGVYAGATNELRQHLAKLAFSGDELDELSRQVYDQLIEAYWQCEHRLVESPHASTTMPVSTEVLESALGRFKQLQRQHNRGSFTSLLAAFPALLSPATPEAITRQFRAVNNQKLKMWLKKAGLNNSTQARKNNAYRAAKQPNLGINTVLLNNRS